MNLRGAIIGESMGAHVLTPPRECDLQPDCIEAMRDCS